MNIMYEYIVAQLFILVIFFYLRRVTLVKLGKKYHRGFSCFELICMIFLSSYYFYKTGSLERQHCVYHHDCSQLIGGELYGFEKVYETYNECTVGATFQYDIDNYEIKYLDEEVPCEETEFGCCSLHTRCQTSIELNFTYDQYWKTYSDSITSDNDIAGVTQLRFKKNDKEGTNCPTYDDIFELREWDEIQTPLYFYLLVLGGVITYFGIILYWDSCSKDQQKFTAVNEEDVPQSASV